MGNEGMSSEELDKLTTEEEVEEESPPVEEPDEETPSEEKPQETPDEEKPEEDLAQAALDETEEKPEVDPKDAVIGGMRRKLRDAEMAKARAEGELAARQAGPPEKSPLELAAEEQGVSVDEVSVDGKLLNKEIEFRQKQTEARTQQQQFDDYKAGTEAASLSLTDEILGEGLGVEALGRTGEHLLTDDDRRTIYAAGKNCGTVLYGLLKKRILEAGGPAAQALQNRLNPTTKPKEEPKPKPKPKAKVSQDEGDESEVRASTNMIMQDLEMF